MSLRENDLPEDFDLNNYSFSYYLGIQNTNNQNWLLALEVTCWWGAFLCYILLKQSKLKLQQIKQRDLDICNPEHDTYCITSLYILKSA